MLRKRLVTRTAATVTMLAAISWLLMLIFFSFHGRDDDGGGGGGQPEAPKETMTDALKKGLLAHQAGPPSIFRNAASTLQTSWTDTSKAIIMGRLSTEDVGWVHDELPEYDAFIYTVDDPSAPGLHTPTNKGREALPYLTHLVEKYDNLSATLVFLHAHRAGFPAAWHVDNQDYSNVDSLRMLDAAHVAREGYANLRCNPAVGCPAGLRLDRSSADPERHAEVAMPAAWAQLMGEHVPLPSVLAQPCCAQFAVSRERVRQRPKADYVRYRDWVLETPLDDELAGRVLEYLWHVIFGKEPVFCPDMEWCYCRLYGACSFYNGD